MGCICSLGYLFDVYSKLAGLHVQCRCTSDEKKKRSIEAAMRGLQYSMGLSFPQVYPALLRCIEMCSEDTFIEHKKLPPDDFF